MGKIIVLDPGHGLQANGSYSRPLIDCTGNEAVIVPNSMKPHKNDYAKGFYREDLGTLRIALNTMSYLMEAGHIVFTTREDKESAELYLPSEDDKWKRENWKRWKWVREFTKGVGADIFVSIHTNAGEGTGCSAFWADPINGKELCDSITNELNKQLDLRIRKVDKHRYMILRDACKGRACLVECLFHDNIDDIKLLLKEAGNKKLARALANGIDKFAQSF